MTIVNAKNALGLVTVTQGFEPVPDATIHLLADALAHALHQAGKTPEDMIPHLCASFATITAAHEQGRPACPECNGTGGFLDPLYSASCDGCGGTGTAPRPAPRQSPDTTAATFMAADCTTSSGDSC